MPAVNLVVIGPEQAGGPCEIGDRLRCALSRRGAPEEQLDGGLEGSEGCQRGLPGGVPFAVPAHLAVADIQAVILVGPEGVVDHMVQDPSLDIETIVGEYITLLRIARSASEDSGAGNLVENIVVSERSMMIARSIPPEHYLILLSRSQDQIGRARYELKQAAREIGSSESDG